MAVLYLVCSHPSLLLGSGPLLWLRLSMLCALNEAIQHMRWESVGLAAFVLSSIKAHASVVA